jgi:CCR4-NOT transcriptional complex subunit CAF120
MQKLRVFSKPKDSKGSPLALNSPDFLSNSNSTPSSPNILTAESSGKLSPELTPIVSLLSAQSHRKYNEGILMLLKDLDSDGNPAERKWLEVYAIMIGNELTYWDSDQLESNGSIILGDSKPSYINFSDGTFKPFKNLPSSNGTINNVIVLSTTLKNRFLLQFSTDDEFLNWCSAFRLSTFEYKTLQEAYTASLLSARGSLLSDIRVILSEKKFNYEDWTSVRFGAGMPWKRCFAVIEPSKNSKKSFKNGSIFFYENEKKSKKSLMAKITNIFSVYALYPRNYTIIDKSTMIKLEGSIQFDQKESSKSCSIFLMPEQHTSVPGYDTLIRFLIPLMDSFNLYGRPKRLNADKSDPNSLLFALPVLPKVHYLEVNDLNLIAEKNLNSIDWDQDQWNSNIKDLLKLKMNKGYNGCGSSDGVNGALDLLNSSKDMAGGKIKFFVNKPEANKYLENSPHARSLQKFSSSEENSLNTAKKINSNNKNLNFLNIEKEDSLYSDSNSNSNSPERSKAATPNQHNTFTNNSPSPQVVNIYQKYAQLPDSSNNDNDNNIMSLNQRLANTRLAVANDDNLQKRDFNNKKQSTINDLYPSNNHEDEDEDDLYGKNYEEEEEDDDDADDDENDDDDDHDKSNFNFVSPNVEQQRVFSPFTDFNNNFKKAIQLDIDQHSPVKDSVQLSNNNKLNVKKQRSPGKETGTNEDQLYPTERNLQPLNQSNRYYSNPTNIISSKAPIDQLNKRAPSNNIVSQEASYDSQDLFAAPLVNPYLMSSHPQTPIDQQHPPPVEAINKYNKPLESPNTPMDHQYSHHHQQQQQQQQSRKYSNNPPKPPPHQSSGIDSPINQGYKRPPPQSKNNVQYTNSPELIPPHQYKNERQQQQQQQFFNVNDYSNPNIAQNASNPLNNPKSPSFGNYGPMKLPSPVINNNSGFQSLGRNQHGAIRPNVGPGNGPADQNPNSRPIGPGPGYNQYPPPQQGYYNAPNQGYSNHNPPPPHHHHHHNQNRLPPQQQYNNYSQQGYAPGYPPQQDYPSQGYPQQQQYQPQPGYPPNNSQPKPRMRGPPPPQLQQQSSSKSFKHDPYAIAKAPGMN